MDTARLQCEPSGRKSQLVVSAYEMGLIVPGEG